ncbi:MAG: flagellar assembly protein FliW [Deferribacteraceae bacterium]|jgi:flagellar assembly factor FliW|nr:flagellar assembly protein FliW [Deferribacteraceae bacterium]
MPDKKITINSAKLGKIEYSEDDTITLASPLLGFAELNDYLIISNTEYFPFLWFQSVEDPSVCFILIEPQPFFPEYMPAVNKRDLKVLGAKELPDLKIFCIVVIPDEPKLSTANLRAPLLVNFDRKIAKQVVLEDDSLSIRASLFKPAE